MDRHCGEWETTTEVGRRGGKGGNSATQRPGKPSRRAGSGEGNVLRMDYLQPTCVARERRNENTRGAERKRRQMTRQTSTQRQGGR